LVQIVIYYGSTVDQHCVQLRSKFTFILLRYRSLVQIYNVFEEGIRGLTIRD